MHASTHAYHCIYSVNCIAFLFVLHAIVLYNIYAYMHILLYYIYCTLLPLSFVWFHVLYNYLYFNIYTGISNITLSEYSITVNAGTNVTVNMTYDANPVPVINMTKSGSVNSGVNYLLTTRDFTFTDVEESDAGVYNVNADNFAGSAQAVFTLTVTKNDDGESTINCLFMCALVISRSWWQTGPLQYQLHDVTHCNWKLGTAYSYWTQLCWLLKQAGMVWIE